MLLERDEEQPTECSSGQAKSAYVGCHLPTHFAGFAKSLFEEYQAYCLYFVVTHQETPKEEYNRECRKGLEAIIARHAYKLVKHTIENTEHIDLDRLSSDEHVLRIPDMTEWAEETK
jgi:hypothetical protein